MDLLIQLEQVRLENSRCLIQPLTTENHQHIADIVISDKELLQYSPSEAHTPALFIDYVETALKGKHNLSRFPFIIYDKEKETYAGTSSYGAIVPQHKRLEIGWTWIGKDFQGTGLNRSMKYLMLNYAFNTLEMERVEFKGDARNLQSCTALEKIGATREGTLRSHTLLPDGFRRDTFYYSILKSEWETIQQKHFANTLAL